MQIHQLWAPGRCRAAAAAAIAPQKRRWRQRRRRASPAAAAAAAAEAGGDGGGGGASRDDASPSSSGRGLDESAQVEPAAPWHIAYQTNERLLQWDESAQVALIKIALADKLRLTAPQVEERLAQLANLLPDIAGKLERARADVLLQLIQDPAATAARLVALRDILPGANVSALVANAPVLMLSLSPDDVRAKVAELRARLPGVDVDALVAREPMLLRADLPRVLAEIARLMPRADPVRLIEQDPTLVLDMEASGQPSTVEVDGVGLG